MLRSGPERLGRIEVDAGIGDLDSPTRGFPIGSMSRTGERPAHDEDVLLGEAPVQHRGDDDYDQPDRPPPRRVMVDARLVVVWLVAATVLAVVAAFGMAIAVVYR